MHFDALTTAAVAAELQDTVVGGRIQGIILTSETSLALEIYASGQTRFLIMSIDPQHARVHLTDQKPQRVAGEPPLLLLLRKYWKNGRLLAAKPQPLERVLALTASVRLDDGRVAETRLICEIMGRFSNIVLLDERDDVLDALKRVPAHLNRYRVILPHRPYVPPPPQQKLHPDLVLPGDIQRALSQCEAETPLWQALVNALLACSPLAAREICYRLAEDVGLSVGNLPSVARLTDCIHAFYEPLRTGQWHPCVAMEGGKGLEFAPYLLTQFGAAQLRRFETISAAIAFAVTGEASPGVATRHEPVGDKRLTSAMQHLRRKLGALEQQRRALPDAERLRTSGELVLAYMQQIEQGETELQAGEERIALDPLLTPLENAQRLFKEYARVRRAREELPSLIERARIELTYLEEAEVLLGLASGREERQRVLQELADQGFLPSAKKKTARAAQAARRLKPAAHSSQGLEIYVGRSARENEEVTFGIGKPHDIWLHARGVPGAHVVLRSEGRDVPQQSLQEAAQLAAYHSAARDSKHVAVDYTERRNVRRIPAAPPGMVSYVSETTISVRPLSPGGREGSPPRKG